MTYRVPEEEQTFEWDSSKKHFAMKPDPTFVSRVAELFTPDDTLLVMCRSDGVALDLPDRSRAYETSC
jgi:hypothetical protein